MSHFDDSIFADGLLTGSPAPRDTADQSAFNFDGFALDEDLEALFFLGPLSPAPDATDAATPTPHGASPAPLSSASASGRPSSLDDEQWAPYIHLAAVDLNRLQRTGRISADDLAAIRVARRRFLSRGYSQKSRAKRTAKTSDPAHAELAALRSQVKALTMRVNCLEAQARSRGISVPPPA